MYHGVFFKKVYDLRMSGMTYQKHVTSSNTQLQSLILSRYKQYSINDRDVPSPPTGIASHNQIRAGPGEKLPSIAYIFANNSILKYLGKRTDVRTGSDSHSLASCIDLGLSLGWEQLTTDSSLSRQYANKHGISWQNAVHCIKVMLCFGEGVGRRSHTSIYGWC